MTDIRLAQRATGALREFSAAGVLAPADVHVALRLGELGGETSETVLLAAALAVRAVRAGSVCLDLGELRQLGSAGGAGEVELAPLAVLDALPWPGPDELSAALRVSPLVASTDPPEPGLRGPLRPLRLAATTEGELLYLDRYFQQEHSIRQTLAARSQTRPAVAGADLRAHVRTVFGDTPAPDRQRVAAALAATEWTTVVAGGPGTGKTHTIARIIAVLLRLEGPGLRVGLAAPTGKAAARLQDQVRAQADGLGLPPLPAATLHRMLGWQPGSGNRFRHNENNRMPYDVVIVDETSMVSLTLMCRLLEAMRPDARLILVGDPDQLASVDAGAVLADLVGRPVPAPPNPLLDAAVGDDLAAQGDQLDTGFRAAEQRRLGAGIVRLSRGRRFGGGIGKLATAIRSGDVAEVLGLLDDPAEADVTLHGPADLVELRAEISASAVAATQAAEQGDALAALAAIDGHRLLCAHRLGPFGAQHWARQAMEWATGRAWLPGASGTAAGWYPGQPLLVTANDHDTRIYNGDTGIVVASPGGGLRAAFARAGKPVLLAPSQLPPVQTVYAMTIHRSQGSQYRSVSVVVPDAGSALLTRELLYTAVTRATGRVRIIGDRAAVSAGVQRQVLRASGLRRMLVAPQG